MAHAPLVCMNVVMVVSHSESIRISKRADAVWKLVGDPGAWPCWAGGVRDVRVQADLAPGALITYAYRGRPAKVTLSALEPERLLEVAGSERHYEMRERIALEADDGSTDRDLLLKHEEGFLHFHDPFGYLWTVMEPEAPFVSVLPELPFE